METKLNLNEETINKLQKLIRANIDSYNGFAETAEEIDDEKVTTLFKSMAAQRSELATELQTVVAFNGEEAEQDGTVAAKTHRIWINIRGKLNGGDPYPLLLEAERGEDHIKEAYEDVLKATAGSAVNDILTTQYAKVKAGHDRVRDLRDALAAAK